MVWKNIRGGGVFLNFSDLQWAMSQMCGVKIIPLRQLSLSRTGMAWVMLLRVVDLFASWNGLHGCSQLAAIWRMVPVCLNVVYLDGKE